MGEYEVNSELDNVTPPMRILICGLGSIGRKHSRILHECFPGIELSVYRSGHGSDSPELSLMSHKFSDLESAILWNPDAAIISSPAPFHQHQALSLTSQRIPVLIEKPLGTGSEPQEGWDELLRHSQKLPIAIGYVLRHDPCAEYIKKILDDQVLGKILEADFYCGSWLPDWRPGTDYRSCVSSLRSMGGGVLLELSHEVDLACWFLGDFDITFASLGQSGLLEVDVEDKVLLAGRCANCSSVTIRLNFCSQPSRRNVVIRCEKGEIDWDLLKGKVDCSTAGQELQSFTPSFQPDDRFRLQAKRFIETVLDRKKPYCTLNDGLKVLKIVNQAHLMSNIVKVNSRVAS